MPEQSGKARTAAGNGAAANPRAALAGSDLNPFDPALFRTEQALPAVTEEVAYVRVGKPDANQWFRVHPDPEFQIPGATICLRAGEREPYLVTAEMAALVPTGRRVNLYTIATFQGDIGLWPANVVPDSGPGRSWALSANRIAQIAMTRWVRMEAGDGQYRGYSADEDYGEPRFRGMSFPKFLELGFGDRIIRAADHPLIRELAGQPLL